MRLITDRDRQQLASSVDGALSGGPIPEDDRFRASEDDDADFVRSLAEEAASHLEGKPADRILAWAAHVVPRFVLTSSFGADSVVLLHLASRVAPELPVLFLDTGFHFDETLDYRKRVADQLGLTVLDIRPDMSVEQQAERYGRELYRTDPDACCRMRKTIPLRRMLRSFDGWATGVRRVQTPERVDTPVVEARLHDGRWLVKVAPLAAWTDEDIDGYVRAHGLPAHPLVEQGYRSIGCRPCTSPVASGESPRSGRWSAFDGKTECGIHLSDDADAVRRTTTPG